MPENMTAYNKKRKELMKGINPRIGAFLCDNPLCQYSDQIVPINANIQIVSEDDNKPMKRHLHITGKGKDVHFCTVCHNAIEMVTAPEPERKDNLKWLKPVLKK